MNAKLLLLYTKFQNLTANEAGQDLVEYALLMAMITLALVSSTQGIANTITRVFTNVSTSLANA